MKSPVSLVPSIERFALVALLSFFVACDNRTTSVAPDADATNSLLELTTPISVGMGITVDSVSLTTTSFPIGGTPGSYAVKITNRNLDGMNSMFVEGFVVQGAARRAGGSKNLQCGTAPLGILPPMITCTVSSLSLTASNSSAGVGTLVSGPALAVIELVRIAAGVRSLVAAKSSPIVLTTGGTGDGSSGVASVSIAPTTASVVMGSTVALVATARNALGQAVPATFTWSSAAPAIATVNASGLVTGVAAGGPVAITATTAGKSASALVTVTASTPSVASVTIVPTTTSVIVGSTVTLTATARNALGQPVAATFTWTSAAPTIASVNSAGVVTGVLVGGPVGITATASGKSATALVSVAPRPVSNGTINVNSAQQFQTMTGWEALQEIGQAECDPRAYQTYRSSLLDRAAHEVGINRIRLGLRNGYENPIDQYLRFKAGLIDFNTWKTFWFQVVNDNADPFVINPAGFNWGYLDYTIEQLVLPLKQRLLSRGDDLWLNISYTGANTGLLHRNSPEEYAEFVLAAFQHIRQKYALTPNSLEIVNEPNLGGWSAQQVAANLVAAKRRLNANGFFPQFVGPTASAAVGSIQYFGQMILVPGVSTALNEISYHRFGGTTIAQLQTLAQYATQYRMRTAMLEHAGSTHAELHDDLTFANVSAWQQFGLAFCSSYDNLGGTYFWISGAELGQNSPVVNTGRLTKMLRQYFRYVQLGAVRLGATTSDARFAPVAFRNKTGKFTVVVKASNAGGFSVGGLPPGTYGINYTTSVEYARQLADVTILNGQTITTAIPTTGVLTIYGK